MYTVDKSALVMHSAEDISNMVNDIDRYADFLPWCSDSRVLCQKNKEVLASVTIDFKGIKKPFITKNRLIEYKKTIITLVEGPFSELSGYWEYQTLKKNTSKISLHLKFNFSNRVTGSLVGPVFKLIVDSMISSFCRRANQIYL